MEEYNWALVGNKELESPDLLPQDVSPPDAPVAVEQPQEFRPEPISTADDLGRLYPVLYHAAVRAQPNMRGVMDQDDLVQEVLMKAYIAVKRGNEIRHPTGWANRVLGNVAVNIVRRNSSRKRNDPSLLMDPLNFLGPETPEEVVVDMMVLQDALGAMQELPYLQQGAIRLVCIEELPYLEAAERLGVTVPKLRYCLNRGIGKLRLEMRSRGYDTPEDSRIRENRSNGFITKKRSIDQTFSLAPNSVTIRGV
ncbi:MAG TPA: sigma-70 family RNA polymerase sigma factor [Candidatus Saccharimonadales bacterium]|nr:sigma-70 family RNA polymerase sigma factor [Candidatus Saccharimonadales bacterium]